MVDKFLTKGIEALNNLNVNDAIKFLKQSKSPDAYLQLGKVYYLKGSTSDALHYFNMSKDPEALFCIGCIYDDKNDHKIALKYYKLCNLPISKYKLGLIYLGNKNFEEAINYLEQCSDLGYAKAQHKLGLIYFELYKDYETAYKYLKLCKLPVANVHLGAYELMKGNYEEALMYLKDSEDSYGQFLLGQIHLEYTHDYELAEKYLKVSNSPASLYKLGVYYHTCNRVGEAVEYFKLSNSPDSINYLGCIHADKKEFELAEEIFKSLGSNKYAQYNLANIYYERGEDELAINLLESSFNQGYVEAGRVLGFIYAEKESYKEALKYLKPFKEYPILGKLAYDLNNHRDAFKYLKLCDDSDSLCLLGKLHYKFYRYDEAVKCFIRSNTPEAHYELGRHYYINRDNNRSIEHYRISASGGYIPAIDYMGIYTRYYLKDKDKAIEYLSLSNTDYAKEHLESIITEKELLNE